MTYELTFLSQAKKEWDKLDHNTRNQFKKKLIERLDKPDIPKDKLSGMSDCYKIKLKASGYRLVYRIIEAKIVIQVIIVGRRDKDRVYNLAKTRLS